MEAVKRLSLRVNECKTGGTFYESSSPLRLASRARAARPMLLWLPGGDIDINDINSLHGKRT